MTAFAGNDGIGSNRTHRRKRLETQPVAISLDSSRPLIAVGAPPGIDLGHQLRPHQADVARMDARKPN